MKRALIAVFTLVQISLFSLEDYISGVYIHPLEEYTGFEDEKNDREEIEKLINDILYSLSGQVYGFKFTYIPSDKEREIKEEFTLTPIASILWGDSGLDFLDSWKESRVLYQNTVYRLNNFQFKRLKSWHRTDTSRSTGRGSASIYIDTGKKDSLDSGIKNSIKAEFQSRGKAKPRIIQGEVLLEDVPRVFINSGEYNTIVKVLINYTEIREYSN